MAVISVATSESPTGHSAARLYPNLQTQTPSRHHLNHLRTTASLKDSTATTTLPEQQEVQSGLSTTIESLRPDQPPPDSSTTPDDKAHSDEIDLDDQHHEGEDQDDQEFNRRRSPPPRYPDAASSASASTSFSLPATRSAPPPFSSLYQFVSAEDLADDHFQLPPSCSREPASEPAASSATAAPAYAPPSSSFLGQAAPASSNGLRNAVAETKRALPQDNKAGSSAPKGEDSDEAPPAYEEGYSPLLSFSYLMAAAGGASSIITQVQQGGPPINAIGGKLRAV